MRRYVLGQSELNWAKHNLHKNMQVRVPRMLFGIALHKGLARRWLQKAEEKLNRSWVKKDTREQKRLRLGLLEAGEKLHPSSFVGLWQLWQRKGLKTQRGNLSIWIFMSYAKIQVETGTSSSQDCSHRCKFKVKYRESSHRYAASSICLIKNLKRILQPYGTEIWRKLIEVTHENVVLGRVRSSPISGTFSHIFWQINL